MTLLVALLRDFGAVQQMPSVAKRARCLAAGLPVIRRKVEGLLAPQACVTASDTTSRRCGERCCARRGQLQAALDGSTHTYLSAAVTMTSTRMPGRQNCVVKHARAGGLLGSTHSFQTAL